MNRARRLHARALYWYGREVEGTDCRGMETMFISPRATLGRDGRTLVRAAFKVGEDGQLPIVTDENPIVEQIYLNVDASRNAVMRALRLANYLRAKTCADTITLAVPVEALRYLPRGHRHRLVIVIAGGARSMLSRSITAEVRLDLAPLTTAVASLAHFRFSKPSDYRKDRTL